MIFIKLKTLIVVTFGLESKYILNFTKLKVIEVESLDCLNIQITKVKISNYKKIERLVNYFYLRV